MAKANSTQINLTNEQLNSALMKIAIMAKSVRQLSISAIDAGDDIDVRDSLMCAIQNLAGQIGWISEICAIQSGGEGLSGADAGYWILDDLSMEMFVKTTASSEVR